ncbi:MULTISPECIES: hypothetical protein [Micromonospora]|uniref:hypothetical protein n=1 Tax=Micromonospora TaxID=1873 RepID=UPI0012FE68F0|nr:MULTISPECIES: hypothetical protein [Micromonospora]MDG4837507.1 hypothetical protein [Micromonospora sp. WMMD967]
MRVARHGLAANHVVAVAFACASVSRHSEASRYQTWTSGRALLGRALPSRAPSRRALQGWKARP